MSEPVSPDQLIREATAHQGPYGSGCLTCGFIEGESAEMQLGWHALMNTDVRRCGHIAIRKTVEDHGGKLSLDSIANHRQGGHSRGR